MKNNKVTASLMLAIMVGLWGGGQAYAQNNQPSSTGSGGGSNAQAKPHNQSSSNIINNNSYGVGDSPVQSRNQRQKTRHSDRKAAAARLKVSYIIARNKDIAEQVKNHGHKKAGAK